MGTRSWVAVAVFVLGILGFGHVANADPRADIQAKSKEAMDSYDLMDYEAAKKLLNQALALSKKAKLDKDPVTARVHRDLAISAFAAGDLEAARAALASAVQIDPKIQIDAAYRSPELTKLLEEARSSAQPGNASGAGPVVEDGVDCKAVKGLQHNVIDTASAGVAQPIEVLLGSDLKPAKVAVLWRAPGATDFTEAKLAKQGACKYTGQIPAAVMRGSPIHYFVGAFDTNNKMVAGKGSSGSPNIIELSGTATIKTDEEDPINVGKTKPPAPVVTTSNVSGGVIAGGKAPRVMIAVTGGTGFGYVTGATEGGYMVEACCIGSSLVVITPELGYHVTRRLTIGVAARIGLPLGANVNAEGADSHSTIAPAGLLRVRYAFSRTGEGVRVLGQFGGGVMRNTITLTSAAAGMDTDIVAQGPLLIGAGLGYIKKLIGGVSFVVDFSAIAAIAIVGELGPTKVNSGIGADLSLGLAFGF